MSPMGLAIFILAVDSLEGVREFYGGVLGWAPTADDLVYLEYAPAEGSRIGFYLRGAFLRNLDLPSETEDRPTLAGVELYLRTADPLRRLQELSDSGAQVLSPVRPRPWGEEVGYALDPAGHVIAVARAMPHGPTPEPGGGS